MCVSIWQKEICQVITLSFKGEITTMKRVFKLLLAILTLSALITFTGCSNEDTPIVNDNEKIKSLKLADSNEDWVNLQVYFDGSSDEKKAEVIKEERVIKEEELLGEIIIQELIKGPSVKSQLKPIFPKEAKLLSFSIKDSIAYINLDSSVKYGMTPAREEACLKSITLSLTQLESIDKVKILIDNKNIETLGGNFNVSKPFDINDINNMKK